MKATEAEDNADAGKHVSHESDDNKPSEHAKGFHETVSESFVKEGENLDENVLDLRLENGGKLDEVSCESLASDVEWVLTPNEGVSSKASGWPSFNTKSSSHTYSLSAEEQEIVSVLRLQHKALEACQEFLVGNAGSDSDKDGNDDDDDDDDDGDEDELVDYYDSEEREEYKFFERVFSDDVDLRRYYENNYKEGEYYCLVCGGIGKKVWKRFKNCIALLQHCTTIQRTKRKQAHRTYAQVICKVVGWDIDQLPAIVLKDFDSSLAASRNLLVEDKKPAVDHIDVSNDEPDNHTDGHIDD
ncbi:uncharacterized protein LOC133291434 [Gastrolobium bilobum]|uniref:uncharacterized protein LOC133291434 n=1 Tax=Gastrolobium bilobum TaxID=150636 RepID=UPI002AB2829B|nr:uncharacterized protein LOC133291434 [Gastrolobium bilobum]